MSRRHKHVLLPPDNISDWYKLPGPGLIGKEITEWLYQETVARFYYTHVHIYFEAEDDAVMYALRWM
jgi:hypothetical protein